MQASVGTGPVHAAFKAIDAVVGVPNTLVEFNVHAVTEGIDALGEVTVRLMNRKARYLVENPPKPDHACPHFWRLWSRHRYHSCQR